MAAALSVRRARELIERADAGELASLDYAARFLEHYRDMQGSLVDSEYHGLPLDAACVHCDSCWAGEPPGAHRSPGHLSLPWVGADYADHRIVLLANNMRNDGELGDEFGVVADVHRALEAGTGQVSRHMGSTFGIGCAAYAHLVGRFQASGHVGEVRDPRALAAERVYRTFARLQTVKCSPRNDANDDAPNPTMGHHCPETYLAGELELLAPRVIVAMGDRAWDRLCTFTELDVPWKGWSLRSATWSEAVLVLATYHPSRRQAGEGLAILRGALTDALDSPRLTDWQNRSQ